MIHIVMGPPCAGKSTYIKEHKKDGDLVVDYDEITVALGSARYQADGIIKQASFAARTGAIEEALKDPESESWIIHTNPTTDQMRCYTSTGAEFITLDPGKDECLARAEADGRPQSTVDAIEKYYEQKEKSNMAYMTKSCSLKSADNGKISGYFSTYDKEPDSYGDIIEPGAFTATIAKRLESGHPFPLCWNHDFSSVIGYITKIEDTDKGPYVEAEFLDTQQAQDVRKMLQSGAVYQFSFAYDVLKRRDPDAEEKANGVYNVLQEVEVYEVSVVTVPANQNAVVTDVKAALAEEIKSGRRNRKSDEDIIKQIITLAQSLLDEPEDKPDETEANEEAESEVNEASEEPKDTGNSKRAEELLGKINAFKEDSNHES